jgi:glycolate oxidase iron-sulfur subunit
LGQKVADNKLLQDAKRIVSQCDRCGACLPVCPLFGAKDIEASSARGKNALVRALAEGGIEPAPELLSAVDFCLLCRTCVETCPSRVATDEAMINVRQYLVQQTGSLNAKYRAVGGFLKSPGLVKLAAGALALFRRLGINDLLPFGMIPEEYTRAHFLTAFAGPAALGHSVRESTVNVTSATKVAYFHGCGMRMMFPEAAAETIRILETTARIMRKDNVCCGLPHLAHGLRDQFFDLARRNIRLYEESDLIVTDCASCGGMLKQMAAWFAHDPEWKEPAGAFSRKVMDLSEYLVKVAYTPRQRVAATFTYHDPCHLVRGQGIRKQPRDLLMAAGRFAEMEDADTCCGGAGAFHMDYPDIAAKILLKKQEAIEKTGSEVVVTGCPGCLIQLTKAAKASGGRFKAMHISQVI